jgi:hypothetical protein
LRKTQSITLTLMAGLAAACSDGRAREEVGSSGDFGAAGEPRSCVDDQNRVVADSLCTRPRAAGGGFYPFFFYYGGRALMSGGGQAVMAGGTRTTLDAPAPRAGRSVSRGGIGARAAGRGGSFGG